MSRTIEMVIKANDEASRKIKGIEEQTEDSANNMEISWAKVAVAIAGAVTAVEMMERKQRNLTETLRRTAYYVGSTTDELRELAVSISGVTRPTEDVVEGLRMLQQRGVENEEQMATLVAQYDTLADALGADMTQTLQDVSGMFTAFGGDINSVIQYGDELSHVFNSTVLEMDDFTMVMRRTGYQIQQLGLDIDDALPILMALADQHDHSARAMYELQRAARSAGGDMDYFKDRLNLTEEQLEKYEERLGDVSGEMDHFADLHFESYTLLQRVLSVVERLQLRYGEFFEILGSGMGVLMSVAMTTFILHEGLGRLWDILKFSVIPAFKTLLGVIFSVTSAKILLVGASLYLIDALTDSNRMIRNDLRQMESDVQKIDNVIGNLEAGESLMESITEGVGYAQSARGGYISELMKMQSEAEEILDDFEPLTRQQLSEMDEQEIADHFKNIRDMLEDQRDQFIDDNEVLRVSKQLDRLSELENDITKAMRGTLTDEWKNLGDVSSEVLGEWEQAIKEDLGIEIDLQSAEGDAEALEDLIRDINPVLQEEMDNLEETAEELETQGIVGKLMSKTMDGIKGWAENLGLADFMHGLVDTLEEALFDSIDGLDLTTLLEESGLSEIGVEVGGEIDEESIQSILNAFEEQMEAIDQKMDTGVYEDETEMFTRQTETATQALVDLLELGLSPTSNEVTTMMDNLLSASDNLEDNEETADTLTSGFIDLVNSGLRPTAEGYAELTQRVRELQSQYETEDVDERVQRAEEIKNAIEEQLEATELMAEKSGDMEYDKEAEQMRILERGIQQLIPLYDIAGDTVDEWLESLGLLEDNYDTLDDRLNESKRIIGNMEEAQKGLNDEFDFTPYIVREAEQAIEDIMRQLWLGTITMEEAEEQLVQFNKILDEYDTSSTQRQLQSLREELDNIATMERLGILDETEADEQRLRTLDRKLDLLVTSEKGLNEETGELNEEAQALREEIQRLEDKLDDTEDEMSRFEKRIKGLHKSIEVMPELGEALGWDDAEVTEKQLQEVERMVQEMVKEGEETVTFDFDGESVTLTLEEMRRRMIEMREELEEFETMWDGFGDKLASSLAPLNDVLDTLGHDFSEMINKAIQVGADFLEDTMNDLGGKFAQMAGAVDPIIAIFLALASHAEEFSNIIEVLMQILDGFLTIVDAILKPIRKLLEVIGTFLIPIFEMLGMMIETILLPVFKALEIPLRLFGIMLLSVAIVIGEVWNALLNLISEIPGIDLTDYLVDVGEMRKAREQLIDGTYDLTDATEDATEAMEELTNVPRGFRHELRRYQASSPDSRPMDIPQMAKGGIVDRATLMVAGEAGTEAVTPIDKLMGMIQSAVDRSNSTQGATSLSTSSSSGDVTIETNNKETNKLLKELLNELKSDGGSNSQTINLENVNIQSDNPEEIWRELKKIIKRENVTNHGTPVEPGSRFV